ncbi:MAG TPA: AbiV family abortive infection protein [Anaerolineales bacterium]|nr:AbiV family abortive infection protein [Anaerolineales bacterium]
MSRRTQNRRKRQRLVGRWFENPLRLHFDSLQLYRGKSYASVLAPSILAREELAKVFLLENQLWHEPIDHTKMHSEWDLLKEFLRSRRIQRSISADEAFQPEKLTLDGDMVVRASNRFREISRSGKLELRKQRSLYVGIWRTPTTAEKDRIENPPSIRQNTPEKKITVVSDDLTDLILKSIDELSEIQSPGLQVVAGNRPLRRVMNAWRYRRTVALLASKSYPGAIIAQKQLNVCLPMREALSP